MRARHASRAVRVLFLAATVLFAAPTGARAATDVTVTVTQGGVGVEGAFVAVIGTGAQKFAGTTDATGKAVFSQLPDGDFTVSASAPGTTVGSAALSTPGETAKTITVNGSATVFSGVGAYGTQTGAIVADGLPGVFYLNTSVSPSLYRTADYGGTWAPVTIASDDKTLGVDGATVALALTTSGYPGEVAVLAGNPTKLYYSRDFGVSWSNFPLPAVSLTPLPGSLNSVRLLWSHPAAPGALSTLFLAPPAQFSMYFVQMPIASPGATPTGFTQMAVSYRGSTADPFTIANGSDAGIVVVGATANSGAPSRVAGQIKLYRVSATPNGNTDPSLAIDNGTVPGAVPVTGTDGTNTLTPSDLFLVRLGGPLTGAQLAGTVLPNTLMVYSDRTSDLAANASITICSGGVTLTCTATLTTTFRDTGDFPTTSGSFSSSTGTGACGATRATGGIGSVSPLGSAGTIGGCWVSRPVSTGVLEVRQVPGISASVGMVFDAAYNGGGNSVLISGDGSKGTIKSSRAGLNASEGPNRPFFPQWPLKAGGGTGSTTGGLAISGINSGFVRDVTFNPSSASQLASVMSFAGGGRVIGSADAGKTWFDVFGRGGDSLGWWNVGSGTQWLVGGAGVPGGDMLAAVRLTSGAPFDASTVMTQISGSAPANFGIPMTVSPPTLPPPASAFILTAIEGLPGTSTAVVAAARTNSGPATSGYSAGSLSLVTFAAGTPGPTASIAGIGGLFSNTAPVSLAYCDAASAASVADKTFAAFAANVQGGTTGGLRVITATSQPARALSTITGITGDFQVVRVDCATGTVWAGKNTVGVSAGTRGLLKSVDGGSSFATIAATGRANEILQKVQSLAIDPRAPNHVVVLSTDTDLVETKDGGFTWTVLNDSTTASCPGTLTTPCGRAFASVPSAIELPPRVTSTSPVTTSELRASSQIGTDQAVVGSGAGLFTATTRSIQRSLLTFGGVVSGTNVIISSNQAVSLSFASAGVNWTATSNQPFVVVSPASGTGNGSFTVSINNTSGLGLQPGSYAALITVQTTGALVSTQTIPVVFVVVASSAAPVGAFDTPVDNSTGLQGSIAVTGWALDDIGIDRVEIWRDLQAGETTPPVVTQTPTDPRNGKIFISNATFVDGARPDVEAAFPAVPQNYRAGWGYLMLTWGLWNQGNGPYTLYAFAFDKEGAVSTIGTKQITVNNNAANKPFGSVDTPSIGGTISGTVFNFGWGLTPKVAGVGTCKIQPSGVQVSIDSGPLQPVAYGDVRSDVAGAFAGFSNSSAAGGHYLLDSTLFPNGVHTIGWFITDDCSRADGVGSRFFNIQNGSARAGSGAALAPTIQVQAAGSGADSTDAVTVAHGHGNLPAVVTPDATGLRSVHVAQGDRIEVRLPPGYDQAYQRVNGVQRALPVGATWDPATGTFYWQPAAAFLGSYELVFARNGEQLRLRVFVDVRKP